MSRIAIQPEWTAEYTVQGDDIELKQIECEGHAIAWKSVPDYIDQLLCDAAKKDYTERLMDAADAETDMRILRRKEGDG